VDLPDEKLAWALERLQQLAQAQGSCIFNIQFRLEGVGIEWHESRRQGAYQDFRQGLVCHGYHADLKACVAEELQRLLSASRQTDLSRR
jgi:hypothetical protein